MRLKRWGAVLLLVEIVQRAVGMAIKYGNVNLVMHAAIRVR